MDSQQAIQVAAQAFVAGGPAALMVEICRLLREGLEAEEADPARLAQVTAALESLIRLGQPLEPVVAIARTLRQQRDTLQQHAHQYYNLSMAAQGEARTAQQELKEAQAAWAQERAALQEQAQKVKRLVAVAAKWGATSQARLEGETKAQAGWEKKKATLEAEVERLTKETADLRRKLDGSNARLRDCQEKLEKVREQRNGHARELSQLQGHLQRMASGRR